MLSEWLGTSDSGAVFDPTRKYRYSLWRRWEPGCDIIRLAVWIGLNPSKANEIDPDPTVTRCINFSKAWGFGGYVMLNAFALVETDRLLMMKHSSPVGEKNDDAILYFAENAGILIAAWGNEGTHQNRSLWLRSTLHGTFVHHLGLNQTGEPKHPLYLKKTTQPILWKGI